MLTASAHRIEHNTPPRANERIRRETERSIEQAISGGEPTICARIAQLDAEWDTERTLEALAASFVLSGVTLGATVDKRWLWLPGTVAAFLLQHALQGWCPPLPVIRALGVRTRGEIERERCALEAARSDLRKNSGLGKNLDRARAPNALLARSGETQQRLGSSR